MEYSTFDVVTEVVNPSCLNTFDGSIAITQLEAIAPFSIEWNIETEDDLLINNLNPDTYILNIIDGNGCVFEEIFDLNAISNNISDCAPIYIPNSFSPNGDGFNDIFSLYSNASNGIENIISFQVFNRWGAVIFEQNNFLPDNGATGWNGDFKGRPLNSGVYVYKITMAFEDGSTLLVSGDVTLLR